MVVRILSTNIKLTPSTRDSIETKIVKTVERLLERDDAQMDIVLDIEVGKISKHRKKGDVWFCEANLSVLSKNKPLRARSEESNLEAAIDEVRYEFELEIKKQKEKTRTKKLKGARRLKESQSK